MTTIPLDHHTIKILVNSGSDIEAWLDAISSIHDYSLHNKRANEWYTFDGAHRIVVDGEMIDQNSYREHHFAFVADTQEDALRIYEEWEWVKYENLS